jgi:phospholipase/carboxylesterase
LVVFLHGLGADGEDLIALAPIFAELLPDAEFIAPNAPFPCDMAPYGRQWFSLQERTPNAILAGLISTQPILDAFLDEALAKRHLTDQALAVVGFSQGTMLALYTALRRPNPPKALVGYSGLLAAPDLLPTEMTARPPVLLVHGQADEVVPHEFLALAKDALELMSVPVTMLSVPGLGHSIDDEGLLAGIRFVANQFGLLGTH